MTEPMKSAMDVIASRRSVRVYNPEKPVEKEKLDSILEAARLAPSSNNTQPWHFIVVTQPELRKQLAVAAPVGASTNKWMGNAPVIIVCCGRPSLLLHQAVGQMFDKDFFKVDVSIAVEHMVIRARELELGTCWVGWFDERKVRRIVNLPSSYKILALLPVGYPKGEWPKPKKRNDTQDIVSWEHFGKSRQAKQ
jgi:nitroreductase